MKSKEKNGNNFEYKVADAHNQQKDVLYRRIIDLELALKNAKEKYEDTLRDFHNFKKDNGQLIEELLVSNENNRKEVITLREELGEDEKVRAIDKEMLT